MLICHHPKGRLSNFRKLVTLTQFGFELWLLLWIRCHQSLEGIADYTDPEITSYHQSDCSESQFSGVELSALIVSPQMSNVFSKSGTSCLWLNSTSATPMKALGCGCGNSKVWVLLLRCFSVMGVDRQLAIFDAGYR